MQHFLRNAFLREKKYRQTMIHSQLTVKTAFDFIGFAFGFWKKVQRKQTRSTQNLRTIVQMLVASATQRRIKQLKNVFDPLHSPKFSYHWSIYNKKWNYFIEYSTKCLTI